MLFILIYPRISTFPKWVCFSGQVFKSIWIHCNKPQLKNPGKENFWIFFSNPNSIGDDFIKASKDFMEHSYAYFGNNSMIQEPANFVFERIFDV